MGLLDEAIRDHLDLKRRRGADPAELERAEREALGPVRRKGDVVATADPDDAAAVVDDDIDAEDGGSFAYDQDHDAAWEHEEPPAHESEPVERDEPPTSWLREPVDDEPAPASRGRLFGRRRREPEPEPASDDDFAQEPPRRHPPAAGETTEFDVDEARAAESDDEDMLEETPEFLQDAPDHDRLWFEQRPPRDFDFDE